MIMVVLDRIPLMKATSFILLFVVHNIVWAVNDVSLCSPNEEVVLACTMKAKHNKTISLCANKDGNNYIEYRYGTQKKVEFRYLVNNINQHKMYRGIYTGASNQVTLYWFYNNGLLYRISVPGWGVVGLDVMRGNKLVFSHECRTNAIGNTSIDSHLITDKEKDSDEVVDILLRGL